MAENNSQFTLSREAKYKYLDSLVGRTHKILHLIEEEEETGYSPLPFLCSQIIEINTANILFNGELVDVIIKLNVIYNNYRTMSFNECKRQIHEITKIIKSMKKGLETAPVKQEE